MHCLPQQYYCLTTEPIDRSARVINEIMQSKEAGKSQTECISAFLLLIEWTITISKIIYNGVRINRQWITPHLIIPCYFKAHSTPSKKIMMWQQKSNYLFWNWLTLLHSYPVCISFWHLSFSWLSYHPTNLIRYLIPARTGLQV